MTEIAHVAAADLTSILTAFRDAPSWLPKAEVIAIGEGLGWRVRSDRETGITFMTGLPFGRARADCVLVDGVLGELSIGLTERVDGDDPAHRKPMAAIEQDLVAAAAQVLGEPAPAPAGRSRTTWDLGSGARVALENIRDRVLLVVLGQAYADVERAEERLGVDPGRVVGNDPEPV